MVKKVVVGISGGIDSAVTAALLKKEGYDVIGLHLKLSEEQEDVSSVLSEISRRLDIEIVFREVAEEFDKEVISYFKKEHLAGNSPSPCAICNPTFKWKQLETFANHQKADYIGTGHYIRKTFEKNRWWLVKGTDPGKDQSYFLWGLKQDTLKRIITPLGGQHKDKTRLLSKEYSLEFLEKKKESAGLCFAGDLSYPELIRKHIPEAQEIPEGDILDSSGKKIGKHKGYIFYTIGQKRDLYINGTKGLCVVKINADTNTLVVGEPNELWKKTFMIRDYYFVDTDFAFNCRKLEVKVRGFGWNPEGYGHLEKMERSKARVLLDNPAWAPAPGQPAVFYFDNLLIGGGIIT